MCVKVVTAWYSIYKIAWFSFMKKNKIFATYVRQLCPFRLDRSLYYNIDCICSIDGLSCIMTSFESFMVNTSLRKLAPKTSRPQVKSSKPHFEIISSTNALFHNCLGSTILIFLEHFGLHWMYFQAQDDYCRHTISLLSS